MAALRLILGDQLSRGVSALSGLDRDADIILMAEVMSEASYVRHHQQKIAFLFSAMRHFAADLEKEGIRVRYVRLDDSGNSGSLYGEVERALAECDGLDELIVTECGEYRLAEEMAGWADRLGRPVEIREDDRFVCSLTEFEKWASGRKTLRMEYFYREMRKKTGLLMDGDDPEGGEWNYDTENRKKLPKGYRPPTRKAVRHDDVTKEVLDLVADRFGDHFGTLDGFSYGVTRDQALRQMDDFIEVSLPKFGDYQDAMATREDFLNHSLLSAYLNAGLLLPMEICEAAEEAYKEGHVPLNAAEGFIRQVIGWREFIRGVYWLKMPAYKETNALKADRPLPDFYWTGETDMHCVAEVVRSTRDNAYAHHIQRLMVTGNFALLAGIAPEAINEWYLIVYADAYEWVQLPNTHGMAIFADGGVVGSKPYAASGAYINRMSDYCSSCRFKVTKKTGDDACPFNYLYWDFLMRNEKSLRGNHRMGMMFKNLDRKSEEESEELKSQAKAFLDGLPSGTKGLY
ncbi:cryptochrome/photolyase family protein [Parvularcula marina]|uniref:Cryptochrome/photolyase family protein n=1 Tax=Parvularcula marina TaxID=2292771 RepID=A0A371REF0_9PROT|nr:cryptochrome/photolyase family protein [Parvularcula marina]RFB03819.1 cryptochrome/photolyase family protein [Parvularcula marina]